MQEESIEKIENFYDFIKNMPNENPEEFNVINSRFKKTYGKYSNLFQTHLSAARGRYFRGLYGRTNLWKDKILPEYYEMNLERIAEKEGLDFKVSNHFFRSRLSLNGSDEIKLDVWSPKFSTPLSFIFGNMVKAKLKKN